MHFQLSAIHASTGVLKKFSSAAGFHGSRCGFQNACGKYAPIPTRKLSIIDWWFESRRVFLASPTLCRPMIVVRFKTKR
jgi:hypothetical protein